MAAESGLWECEIEGLYSGSGLILYDYNNYDFIEYQFNLIIHVT